MKTKDLKIGDYVKVKENGLVCEVVDIERKQFLSVYPDDPGPEVDWTDYYSYYVFTLRSGMTTFKVEEYGFELGKLEFREER